MRKLLLAAAASAFLAALMVPSTSFGQSGESGAPVGVNGPGYGAASAHVRASLSDYEVGMHLTNQQKYADAIVHLELALADNPYSADTLKYLGYANYMMGKNSDSLVFFRRALAIDPKRKGVHEYLGELYLQMSDLTAAKAELATLAELCPGGCNERAVLEKAIAANTPSAGAVDAAAGSGPNAAASTTPTATTAGH